MEQSIGWDVFGNIIAEADGATCASLRETVHADASSMRLFLSQINWEQIASLRNRLRQPAKT